MNFNNDNSLQSVASTLSTAGNFINVVYSNVLNSYQTSLIPSTILYGVGSNLTLVNYNNLSNLPSYSLMGANNGYLSNMNGVITLNLPTNYSSSMTISNLISPTSFIYQGSELSNYFNINSMYDIERVYPPKAYNSSSTETTITFLNKTVYYENITINDYINGYGIGTYNIYSSSAFVSAGYTKKLLFNYNTTEGTTTAWEPIYINGGLYPGTNYIKSDYIGEWIIVKFPNPIILTKFRFYNRSGTLTRAAPGEWKCYGSIDGITFNEIVEGNQSSRLNVSDYVSLNYYEKQLEKTFNTLYYYIGWTINKLAFDVNYSTSTSYLNFTELKIYGYSKNLLSINGNQTIYGTLSNSGTIISTGTLNASSFIYQGSELSSSYLNKNSNAIYSSNLIGNPSINVSNITSTGSISGIGSNLTLINYNNIYNLPSYTLTGANNGYLSNINGIVSLNMPTNYSSSMTISNLISPTSFIYQGNELSNYLNMTSTAINASNLIGNPNINTGTINATGNVTAPTFIGSLTGNASTASNLTGSPNITVGTINATSIQEGGTSLSSKYLNTSSFYFPDFNLIKQYPPKLYDSSTVEITTTFLSKTVYYQTITINSYTNGYGIGIYNIYSSSSYSTGTAKVLLFNYDLVETGGGGAWANSQYDASGIYITANNNYIKNDYLGDWIIIKLPNSIILTKFRFYQRSSFPNRTPGEWKCYGSIDGITFTEITEGTQSTRLTTSNYSSGYYEKQLASTFITSYNYFGWTVNKLAGNDTIMNFLELQIYGTVKNYLSLNDSQTFSGTLSNSGTIINNGNITGTGNINTYGLTILNSNLIINPNNFIYADATYLTNITFEYQNSNYSFPPINNFSSSSQTFNNQIFGNGTYTISASTSSNSTNPYSVFDGINNSLTNSWFSSNFYSSNNIIPANYFGTSNTIIKNTGSTNYPISGEWIQMNYNKGFCARQLTLNGIINNSNSFPYNLSLVSSFDNSNWQLLSKQSNVILNPTGSNTITFNNNTAYDYYRLIINNTSNSSNVIISEMNFQGTQNSTYINADNFNSLLYNTDVIKFPSTSNFSSSSETTSLNNEIYCVPSQPYKQTITMSNKNNDIYTIYSSSTTGTNLKSNLFNSNLSDNAYWSAGNYSTSTTYSYTYTTPSSSLGLPSSLSYAIRGDWIVIKFPFQIILNYFNIIITNTNNAPGLWNCFGSDDGIIYNEITDASQTIQLTSASYINNTYTKTLLNKPKPYLYLGWVFTNLAGNLGQLIISELQIFGYDNLSSVLSRIKIDGSGTVFFNAFGGTLSDMRYKKNINRIESKDALTIINKLDSITYNLIDDNSFSSGLIAQDVREILPFLVNEIDRDVNKTKQLTLNYLGIIPYLIESTKELNKIINEKNKIIENLQDQINDIKKKIYI